MNKNFLASLFCICLLPAIVFSQIQDSGLISKDSVPVARFLFDTSLISPNKIINQNKLIRFKAIPVNTLEQKRNTTSKETVFYLIVSIFLFLGILKATFTKYFNNLFRVFFNTSLRQSQLTDQLLQAKIPSFLMNVFFVLIGGLYLFLLLNYYYQTSLNDLKVLIFSIFFVTGIYVSKFIMLQFGGWLSGHKQEIESYIFIVFMMNKMIALLLAPFVILIAFADNQIKEAMISTSYVLITLLFIFRFFRSYSLLQQRVKMNRFHFILYIVGVELLPIFLIYKGSWYILSKYL